MLLAEPADVEQFSDDPLWFPLDWLACGHDDGMGRAVSDQPAAPGKPVRPAPGRKRWTSFVADVGTAGTVVRGLHEQANPNHRLRVEHDAHTLLIHLSDEDGGGWTTFAVDRQTRQWAVTQDTRQSDTARSAYDSLYER
ncbi:MAG: hypothetical protein H0W01_13655 [Pseudonocardiales bacterium]|nr:hypothetical protein [Pseudonocardiales bacterium]